MAATPHMQPYTLIYCVFGCPNLTSCFAKLSIATTNPPSFQPCCRPDKGHSGTIPGDSIDKSVIFHFFYVDLSEGRPQIYHQKPGGTHARWRVIWLHQPRYTPIISAPWCFELGGASAVSICPKGIEGVCCLAATLSPGIEVDAAVPPPQRSSQALWALGLGCK